VHHPSPRVASGRFQSDYIASGILADDWLRDYDVDPPDGFEKITLNHSTRVRVRVSFRAELHQMFCSKKSSNGCSEHYC